MKWCLCFIVFMGSIFFSGCTQESGSELNSTKIEALEVQKHELMDDNNTVESVIFTELTDENISLETPLKTAELAQQTVEKKVVVAPIKPSILSYSALVTTENELALTVMGERGASVYIDDMLYGQIDESQSLDINLSNPKEDEFETFQISLSNQEGMESAPLFFTTTFNRKSIDSRYTYYVPSSVYLSYRFYGDVVAMSYPYNTELISLIMPFRVNNEQSKFDNLNTFVRKMQENNDFILKFKGLSEQRLIAQDSVITEYTLETKVDISSANLLEMLLLGSSQDFTSSITHRKEKKFKKFNIKVNLFQKYKNEAYLSIAIVPQKSVLKYQTQMNSMINSRNIQRNTTKVYMQEELLKAKAVDQDKNFANFLFVIDDSGSMGDYQWAISKTAREFTKSIEEVGLRFRIAVITTGTKEEAFASLESNGIMENDMSAFSDAIQVGTDGSAWEAALYNVEQALQSTKYGNQENGMLTSLGMPKMNEQLSIIILSDEGSSYRNRAGKDFDFERSPIVKRGYKVYLIGASQYDDYKKKFEHRDDTYGLYGELAKQTGGLVHDIYNLESYPLMMKTINEDILGNLGYKLRQKNIIESTIYVEINGDQIRNHHTNGWRYVSSQNSILFSGEAIPNEDDTILVRYGYTLDD